MVNLGLIDLKTILLEIRAQHYFESECLSSYVNNLEEYLIEMNKVDVFPDILHQTL